MRDKKCTCIYVRVHGRVEEKAPKIAYLNCSDLFLFSNFNGKKLKTQNSKLKIRPWLLSQIGMWLLSLPSARKREGEKSTTGNKLLLDPLCSLM